MLDGQGHHLVQVEDLHSLVNYVFVPESTDLSQAAHSFLLIWLTPLSGKELGHEFLANLPNSSFEVVTGLLLLADREKTLAIGIKSELHDQICCGYPIVCCIEWSLHLPTKLNLRSPCANPEISPPGVMKQTSV
jgi:hypothetical protein